MQIDKFYTDPVTDHVPLNQLRRYQTDALSLAERHQVEKHLLHCNLCADVLEGMAASPEPVTQLAVQDINRRLTAVLARRRQVVPFYASSKNRGVAAAVLLFIMSGTAVFYYNLGQVNQKAEILADKAASAPAKTQTIVKPASPSVAETNKPAVRADSTPQSTALAFRTPGATQSPAPPNLQMATAPVASATENSGSLNNRETEQVAIQVTPPFVRDTPAVAAAPSIALEEQLSGRVAGVETNQKIRIRGNQSGALRESSSLTGRVVTGQVSDENGEPLPGVTIGVKGTTVGAVTNAAGGYTLSLPEGIKEATLTYSFIGFTTTEKQVTALAAPLVLNIALKPDARALSEVVVVGYGTQAKSEVTGAVTYARPTTGFKAFKRYIQANIKYPETAGANKIKGRVVVGFTVDPNGTLSDFRIIKSLSAACDAEALRLLQEGPRWEPTKKDGLAVSEQVRIAIRFKPY